MGKHTAIIPIKGFGWCSFFTCWQRLHQSVITKMLPDRQLHSVVLSPGAYLHCPPLKKCPLCDCLYLCQKLTDLRKKFFTGAFCGQLAIKWLLNTPPHVSCVATLPCETQMQEKLTIINSKRVGKQNTLLNKNAVNDLYDATL